MTVQDGGIVRLPGEAPVVAGLRGGTTAHLAGEQDTGGAYALKENVAPPGTSGAPPHIHHEGEEAFYVLEGELTVRLGGRTVTAAAGSFVLVSRGVVHSFDVTGAGTTRYLVLFSPARIGGYFDELRGLADAAPGGALDRRTIAAVARAYGTEYLERG